MRRQYLSALSLTLLLGAGLALSACTADDAGGTGRSSSADGPALVGLVIKASDNPFFVRMAAGANETAAELGVQVQTYAGSGQSDNRSQVAAVDRLVEAGAAGLLITPADSQAIVPALQRARDAGLLVIALDTPTEPADAVDATFASDNYRAGTLIGAWARATMDADGIEPRIAMLNLTAEQVSVDVQRNQGFLAGFGVDTVDPGVMGDEDDARIVAQEVSEGNAEGGREAMEAVLARHPDVTLVYTVNEPAAEGAHRALVDAGVAEDVTLVSIDGGCRGVRRTASGALGATAMQFPLNMASLGVEAVAEYARTGEKPPVIAGLQSYNTGVELVTDSPVPGVQSQDSDWGLDNCWG